MISYTYSYIILSIIYLSIWLILFYLRKDLRREMLIISLIFAFAGPLADIIYFQDWWRPFTLTGSFLSLEPFIIGFSIGGVASVIYEEAFNLRQQRKKSKPQQKKQNFNAFLLLFTFPIIFFGSFYVLKLNSLITTIITFGIPTLVIYMKRRDLIANSLLSGFLLTLVAALIYTLTNVLTPNWVNIFWLFKNTPNFIFLNVPIDDIIWYFLCGAFIGPLYEYWKEISLYKKQK